MEAGQDVTVEAAAERLAPPVAGPPRPLRAPTVAERKLRTGLRVLVVRKPTVPKVELQLVVPLGRRSPGSASDRILAKTFAAGTSERSSVEIARELQRLGASLEAGTSADYFAAGGSVLQPNLGAYIGLLAELLTDSVFPAGEVALERERVLQEIQMARAQQQFLATEATRRRLFGRHPYGVVQPSPEAVAKTGRGAVARLYTERVQPREAVLVVVGDVQPKAALDRIEDGLSVWKGRKAVPPVPTPPPPPPGPTLVVDRPGSVQTTIRLAGPAVPPGHRDSYALECANAVFGGTFASRLVMNIREDKGYTYSPGSGVQHLRRASYFECSADVGTEVTAPSLVEMRYELGRMASLEVEKEELTSAQRYLAGIMAIRIQSQRGVAAQLARLAIFGLGVGYLKDYAGRISAVTTAEVRDVARAYLAPGRLACVLVGDASRIGPEIEGLEPIDVRPSE